MPCFTQALLALADELGCSDAAQALISLAVVSGLSMGAMCGVLALGFHLRGVEYGEFLAGHVADARGGAVLFVFGAARLADRRQHRRLARVVRGVGMVVSGPTLFPGRLQRVAHVDRIGIILEQAMMFTFGKEPRSSSADLGQAFRLGGLSVPWLQLISLAVAIGVAGSLHLFAQRTRYSKALLAVVQNPQAAS